MIVSKAFPSAPMADSYSLRSSFARSNAAGSPLFKPFFQGLQGAIQTVLMGNDLVLQKGIANTGTMNVI